MRRFQIILIVVSAFLILSLGSSVTDLWSRRDILTIRQAKLSELQKENGILKKKLQEVETPGFVEREARERLGLSKPEETVVILKDPQMEVRPASEEDIRPHWKQWWEVFF